MTTAEVASILGTHYASLTPADEREIAARVADEADVADYALRTCSCGTRIDGFYEYLDHLKEVLSMKPHDGEVARRP